MKLLQIFKMFGVFVCSLFSTHQTKMIASCHLCPGGLHELIFRCGEPGSYKPEASQLARYCCGWVIQITARDMG